MAVVLLITTCAVVFSGNVTEICNAAEIRSGVSTQVDSRTEEKTGTEPCKKEGGGKFRIAFVDYDEYMPASRQFYYILSDLEEKGWIRLRETGCDDRSLYSSQKKGRRSQGIA